VKSRGCQIPMAVSVCESLEEAFILQLTENCLHGLVFGVFLLW